MIKIIRLECNSKIIVFRLLLKIGRYSLFYEPESLQLKRNNEGIDGEKLDIWAFGVTLFCFPFLELPFY